jgi:splicing factor U2AF subunit
VTLWDITAEGYENVTAEMARLSGLFPLPGSVEINANRETELTRKLLGDVPLLMPKQDNEPSISGALLPAVKVADAFILQPSRSRLSKQVIISSMTQEKLSVKEVGSFVNTFILSLRLTTPNPDRSRNPTLNIRSIEHGAKIFAEFQTAEQATAAVAYSGLPMDASNPDGSTFDIVRPSTYIAPEIPKGKTSGVPDSPDKIAITHIPTYVSEEQLMDLLNAFGEVRSSMLIKDTNGNSKGFAFCEFKDQAVTDVALTGLNGLKLGDSPLQARLICSGLTQPSMDYTNVDSVIKGSSRQKPITSNVALFLNMVSLDDLQDADGLEDIRKQIQEECEKYGKVLQVFIPPAGFSLVGKVYVHFESDDDCLNAVKNISGRRFSEVTVFATLYDSKTFSMGIYQ